MNETRRCVIGSDHAGFPLKGSFLEHLRVLGYQPEDQGPFTQESCDYPEFAARVCRRVLELDAFGILICGTGLGMSMAANRFPAIRAALCVNEFQARMARRHNNANVLCLGARVLGEDLAFAVLDAFLSAGFEGGRHDRRVALLDDIAG
jgi:ribose 5-phosphate isomerase B